MKSRILIYGATGYMGRLIVERAAKLGLPIVLGGRNPAKLAEFSASTGLPFRAFALETPAAREKRLKLRMRKGADDSPNKLVDGALGDIGIVVNAAGPFGETAEPLARACGRTETHYLDIGGEYAVFGRLEVIKAKSTKLVLPGVGLTVLGSELLALAALTKGKEMGLGEPHVVRVALSRVPEISRGSAKTMLDSVRDGVLIREHGKTIVSPIGRLVRSFNFGAEDDFDRDEPRTCTALTLADGLMLGAKVHRAWTGKPPASEKPPASVPNVETYVEASAMELLNYEIAGGFALAFRSSPIKETLDRLLNLWPEGPRLEERNSTRQQIYLEIEDRYRRSVQARFSTPNSYDFTAAIALQVVTRLRGAPALDKVALERYVLEELWNTLVPDTNTDPDGKDCRVNIAYRGARKPLAYQPKGA